MIIFLHLGKFFSETFLSIPYSFSFGVLPFDLLNLPLLLLVLLLLLLFSVVLERLLVVAGSIYYFN